MVSLRYRKDRGFWVAEWREGGRVRKQNCGRDRRTAEILRKKIEQEIRLSEHGIYERPERVMLSDLVERYLGAKRSAVAPRTFENTDRSCRRFLEAVGDVPIRSLTPEHAERFLAWLRRPRRDARPIVAENTLARHMIPIRNMLRMAVSWRLLDRDPLLGYSNLPKVDWYGRDPDYFTAEQVAEILAAAKAWPHSPTLYPLLAIVAYTGMRFGEACALTWADVDLDAGLVQIRTKKMEGGGRWRPKGKRDSLLPLHPKLVEILRPLERTSNLVLPSASGSSIQPSAQKMLQRFRKTLKRPEMRDLRFHKLRHSLASLLVSSGVPLDRIQLLLTHSDPRVSRIYAHLKPSSLREDLQRISFDPSPPTPEGSSDG